MFHRQPVSERLGEGKPGGPTVAGRRVAVGGLPKSLSRSGWSAALLRRWCAGAVWAERKSRQAPFTPSGGRAANQEAIIAAREAGLQAAPSGGRFPAADLPCERYSAFSSALNSERNGLCDIGSLIDPLRMSAMATWRP